jgi:hypothetical protein
MNSISELDADGRQGISHSKSDPTRRSRSMDLRTHANLQTRWSHVYKNKWSNIIKTHNQQSSKTWSTDIKNMVNKHKKTWSLICANSSTRGYPHTDGSWPLQRKPGHRTLRQLNKSMSLYGKLSWSKSQCFCMEQCM